MRLGRSGRAVLARLPRLVVGLCLFGFAIGLMARGGLGLSPWDVLHQGISLRTGVAMGTVSIILGALVLLAWIPLGERPGIGTLLNVILVGTSVNVALAVLLPATGLLAQVGYAVGGLLLYALATGMYLSTDLGPGPRDGLMTGIHHRFGWRISWARGTIEVLVLLVGFAFGGTVGLGTLIFAAGIGPLTELSLRFFDPDGKVMRKRIRAEAEPVPAEGAA